MTGFIVDLAQGSDDWHLWRRAGIGSSDAPAIMGVSPWQTQRGLWELKTGRGRDRYVNRAMARGTRLEPIARELYEYVADMQFPPACFAHERHPFMKASVDGYNAEQDIIIELKCPSEEDHQLAAQGTVPAKYQPQVWHQLMVSGCREARYVSFDGEDNLEAVVVERDEIAIQQLFDAEVAFWAYVMEDEMPPLPQGWIERADEEWLAMLDEYKVIQDQLRRYEHRATEYKERLIALAGNQQVLSPNGTWSFVKRRGLIDYKDAAESLAEILGEPVDWEDYRKVETGYWRVVS